MKCLLKFWFDDWISFNRNEDIHVSNKKIIIITNPSPNFKIQISFLAWTVYTKDTSFLIFVNKFMKQTFKNFVLLSASKSKMRLLKCILHLGYLYFLQLHTGVGVGKKTVPAKICSVN